MSPLKPFFSVVITTFNRLLQVQNAIRAVQQQTFPDFEIIVVDDASTDGTIDVLQKSVTSGLRLYATPVNSGGPAAPRNMGIAQSRGRWVCFCDSDDHYDPHHLQKLYEYITGAKLDDGIISTNAYITKSDCQPAGLYFQKVGAATEMSLLKNWKRNHAILSSCCIRNTQIIPFREESKCTSIEDYIFLLENMIGGKKHYYLPVPGVYYNTQSDDSLRAVHNNGRKAYFYKWALFWKYSLWKRAAAPPMLLQIGIDLLKDGYGSLRSGTWNQG